MMIKPRQFLLNIFFSRMDSQQVNNYIQPNKDLGGHQFLFSRVRAEFTVQKVFVKKLRN